MTSAVHTTTPPPVATSPAFIAAAVRAMANGDTTAVRSFFTNPDDSLPNLRLADVIDAEARWIQAVFADPAASAAIDVDLFLTILREVESVAVHAGDLVSLTWFADVMATLAPAPGTAAELVSRLWFGAAAPTAQDPDRREWRRLARPVWTWIRRSIGIAGLNDRTRGLGARLVFWLWHTGEYDVICDLVAAGIDVMQPYRDGSKAALIVEGIRCGYVEPLGHVLGKYVWRVHLAAKKSLDADEARELRGVDPARIAGAGRILDVLGRQTHKPILTTFQEVLDSDFLTAFTKQEGTIWGFEYVRLPYAQAAHQTPKGQRPLRMIELWDVVGEAITTEEYEKLFTRPDETIRRLVDAGVKKVRAAIATSERTVIGHGTEEFVKAFADNCTDYLKFLVGRPPTAKTTTIEKRGSGIRAYMAGIGCTAGLWWAKRTGEPVYYCIDGLRIQDAINYKTYTTTLINDFLAGTTEERFSEVITLTEMREILTNWKDFHDVVTFVSRGKLLTGPVGEDLVLGWIALMNRSDEVGPARRSPARDAFAADLAALGLAGDRTLSDHDAMRVVALADGVRRSASAGLPVLAVSLGAVELLVEHGVIPNGMARGLGVVLAAARQDQAGLAATWKEKYLGRVCANVVDSPLRTALVAAADAVIKG